MLWRNFVAKTNVFQTLEIMKKIIIKKATQIILVFIGLLLFNCGVIKEQKITYADRMSKCIKAAESTRIEVTVEGSDKKGYSIEVEPSCIVGASLPEFDIADMGKNRIRTKDLMGKINKTSVRFHHHSQR